jgi:hypothetical protein
MVVDLLAQKKTRQQTTAITYMTPSMTSEYATVAVEKDQKVHNSR